MRRTKFALLIATLIVALIASATSLALATPILRSNQTPQPLAIGVIGPFDGPTAQGVTLAVQRLSALGPLTSPDGTNYTLSVVTANATTSEEVASAITQLKKNNVAAIFGPDDNKLVADSLAALNGAGVPVFTGATATSIQTGGLLFRTRAAENWRMAALADEMITDQNKNKFAIFQGSPDVSDPVGQLVSVLTKRGKPPAPPVLQTASGKIADSASVLMKGSPEVIVAFGDPVQLADLYRTLRASSYNGLFSTSEADNRAFISAIPEALRPGIYGVTNWPYSWNEADSSQFLRDYVALFGTMPTPLSAASYDTAVALAIAIKNGGIAPDAIRTALLKLPKSASLQGFFNPGLGNNNLSASVSIILTNRYGAPTLVARYEDTGRVKLTNPTPSPFPAATLPPSATPAGVVGTAKSTVNVRTGPGANYPVIGQLRKGDQVPFIGASADFSWFVIDFRQQQGWVSAPLFSVFGDVKTLPIINPPPTPIPTATPLATLTPSPVPLADIVMQSATLNPSIPAPGQPFTLAVVIKNQGGADAGPFAVATGFNPGNVYSAVNVPGLPAGQQTTVNLSATVSGTGVFTVAIVLDLNKQLNEDPNARAAHGMPTFTYKIDHPYIAQGQLSIAPVNSVDFDSGGPDVSWDGTKMSVVSTAKIGVLSGVQFSNVTFDTLVSSTVNTSPIPMSQLPAGTLVSVVTAQNHRGVLQVTGYAGNTIMLNYYIYAP